MAVPTFQTRCTHKKLIARDVYEFRFERPEGLSYKPGQFVLFDVPLLDDPQDIQTRAYSIASHMGEDELLFVLKLTPGGRASAWFEKQVEIGTVATIKGPFGVFTFRDQSPRDALFIATGTGIAPFRGHILERLRLDDTRRMDLVFGVRTEADIFWMEELEEWAAKHPNLRVHLSLGEPSSEWTGHRERVQELIPIVADDIAARDIYICGSPAMTSSVKALCKEQWAVDPKQIHVEGYI